MRMVPFLSASGAVDGWQRGCSPDQRTWSTCPVAVALTVSYLVMMFICLLICRYARLIQICSFCLKHQNQHTKRENGKGRKRASSLDWTTMVQSNNLNIRRKSDLLQVVKLSQLGPYPPLQHELTHNLCCIMSHCHSIPTKWCTQNGL
jgi:hypothetical protein